MRENVCLRRNWPSTYRPNIISATSFKDSDTFTDVYDILYVKITYAASMQIVND